MVFLVCRCAAAPVEVEIIRREYSESTTAYGCLGVLRVNVDTESFHYLVLVTECQSVGKVGVASSVGCRREGIP